MEKDNKGLWIAAAAAVSLAVAFGFYRRFAAPPPTMPAPSVSSAAQSVPPPSAPASSPLPSLDQSDGLARQAAQALFTGARLGDWLQTEGLLRRLTAAVAMIGEGKSPREALSFLQPGKKFKFKTQGGKIFIDPASYRRYDRVADVVGSLDAQAAAKTIGELRPLFQQACGELDARCDFQAALLSAIKVLLKTPIVAGEIRLRKKVLSFAMADEALESLSPVQKQLLRMGPDNEAKVQAKLRELALALGSRPDELPRP